MCIYVCMYTYIYIYIYMFSRSFCPRSHARRSRLRWPRWMFCFDGRDGFFLSTVLFDFLPKGKTVAKWLIVIPVPLNLSESVSTILFCLPKGKAVAKCLIAIPVLLIFPRVTFDDSLSFTTFTNYDPLQSNPLLCFSNPLHLHSTSNYPYYCA